MSLSRYANPLDAFIADAQLGQRGTLQQTICSDKQVEHITRLLRHGLSRGIGVVNWCIRAPLGHKFSRDELDAIAADIDEGFHSGEDWRLEVRT